MTALAASRTTLEDWLEWQLAQHTQEIQLGLDRVRTVAESLALLPVTVPCVIVAGTNGKGSTATLVAGLLGASASVGLYTSPHLWRYNERIAIDGEPVSDAAIVDAFEAIEAVRGDLPLTYFEFGTLAALWIFARRSVDYLVLEVGLGGRLDAVNIVDADVALITQIGLDHCDWLGSDREAIGHEKAGVLRAQQPAFCADRDQPASIAAQARRVGANLKVIAADFDIGVDDAGGQWLYRQGDEEGLTLTAHAAVMPDNLALAIAGVRALGLPLNATQVANACAIQARLAGRREVVDAPIPIIYDVGHNVDAVTALVSVLAEQPAVGRTHVVIGMLSDKPIEAVADVLTDVADCFYPVGLAGINARGLDGATMAIRLGEPATNAFDDPQAGLSAARSAARLGDRIVVCGSFFTVAQARRPDDG